MTIPPGQTSGVFTMPLVGNTVPTTAARSYQVVAGISTNAAIGGFARLVVTGDDTVG